MDISLRKGFSFGLTSAVITTLGLIVGLGASTHSKFVIVGGIITIAISDAFSDALGIYVSGELDKRKTKKTLWEVTLSTFFAKLVFMFTFIIPFLLLELYPAAAISILWGLLLIGSLIFEIAKEEKITPWKVILKHLIVMIVVLVITFCFGQLTYKVFNYLPR
ncbi:MAG: hypothetical protein PHG05_02545 [Candidatus Nanoarchaeia archaeon]|nr:hypothetical protein [Candidatus Nanoarchaeia archaeon]